MRRFARARPAADHGRRERHARFVLRRRPVPRRRRAPSRTRAMLIEEGADILDIGGESTRPGARRCRSTKSCAACCRCSSSSARAPVPVSVDTRKPELMREAIAAGALDDQRHRARCEAPGALEAVAQSDCGVCLMHKQGEPQTMQQRPALRRRRGRSARIPAARVRRARGGGHRARAHRRSIPASASARRCEHNLELLRELTALAALGLPGARRPVAQGACSAKLTGRAVDERVPAALPRLCSRCRAERASCGCTMSRRRATRSRCGRRISG